MDYNLPLGVLVPVTLVWVGWSMVSLDRRLRGLERSVSALLRHFNIDPTAVAPPSDEVKRLAADPARTIDAIRLYRQETGADLKVAKAIVDKLPTGP